MAGNGRRRISSRNPRGGKRGRYEKKRATNESASVPRRSIERTRTRVQKDLKKLGPRVDIDGAPTFGRSSTIPQQFVLDTVVWCP